MSTSTDEYDEYIIELCQTLHSQCGEDIDCIQENLADLILSEIETIEQNREELAKRYQATEPANTLLRIIIVDMIEDILEEYENRYDISKEQVMNGLQERFVYDIVEE